MIDLLVWIAGVPIIVVLVISVIRRAIALKAEIRKHFDEEARGVKDPYSQMAAMANVQQAIDDERRRARQANELLRPGRKKTSKK